MFLWSNPIRKPNGAKTYEKICSKRIPNPLNIILIKETKPTKAIKLAPIEKAICAPVLAPSAIASITLALLPLLSILMSSIF